MSLGSLPPPRLRLVENCTPFSCVQFDKMAPGRRFFDIVVVKGVFALTAGCAALLGEAPVYMADEYWDDGEERSSVRMHGDAVLTKPGTDVIVTGTARTPVPKPRWDVAVAVHGRDVRMSHALVATGPRRWEHRRLRGWTLSDPSATREVPIRYELAYGGAAY